MVETMAQQVILAALDKWRKTLVSFDGNNRQIFYRKKKLADVSFDDDYASAEALESLIQGTKTRVSSLYPDLVKRIEVKQAKTDLSLDAALDEDEIDEDDPAKQWSNRLRRFEAVYRKTVEDEEEKNIQTCFLAEGFATWRPKQSGTVVPNAPLLLHPMKITAVSKGNSDFSVEKNGPSVINEALALYLETEFAIPHEVFVLTEDEPRLRDTEVKKIIATIKETVPGFKVQDEFILGNFAFLLYPMVMDLQRMMKMFINHPVLGLLAGTTGAAEKIGGIGTEEDLEALSIKNPIIENLVFPADSSQHSAISAIMGGKNIVIQGPPGTGKSQTIANVIAECAANKKSVLFVAEKRAAIDAVVERLGQKNLAGIVLDLHGEPDKKTIAKNLMEVLKTHNVTREPSNSSIDKLLKAKQLLQRRWNWINQPTSVSSYAGVPLKGYELLRELGVRGSMLDRSVFSYSQTYIPDIEKIDTATRDAISERLDNLNNCNYFEKNEKRSVVNEFASSITLENQVNELVDSILNLNSLLKTREAQNAHALAKKLLHSTLDNPSSILETLDAYIAVSLATSNWDMNRYETLESKLVLFESLGKYRKARGYGFFKALRERKSEITDLKTFRKGQVLALAPKQFASELKDLIASVKKWEELGGDVSRLKVLDPGASVTHDAISHIDNFLKAFCGLTFISELGSKSVQQLGAYFQELQENSQFIRDLPRINESLVTLKSYGISGILEFFQEKKIQFGQITDYWEYIWFDAHVRKMMMSSTASNFNSSNLNDAVREFRARDQEFFKSNPGKILRRISESLLRINSEGNQLLKKESFKNSGHLPFRELFSRIPNEILAIKPCFAMSPLAVSRILPCKEGLFDLVIFDEASQIRPENAITSIFRGKQLAVAGDRYQLPPTSVGVSSRASSDDFDDVENPTGEIDDMESILDALLALYPGKQMKPLTLHYRSNDERLISWSNYYIYKQAGQELASFPSTGDESYDVLRHTYIPGVKTQSMSRANEVEIEEVVKAVKKHIKETPDMSLGIIAFGSRHAVRLQDRFNILEREDSNFYDWKSKWEEKKDRFFVKNIERVQGDERDAIIITPGYAPNLEGSVLLNFGTLNNEGGERRLNVAASRARKYMHLITSLRSTEIDLSRTKKRSVGLFKSYLSFMENNGRLSELPDGFGTTESPFEEEVLAALEKKGLLVDCQVGESKYKLDFAIRDPKTNKYVLAVEADGATYHSSPYARERDWLRQEILESKGWSFCRIWSTDWWENPDFEVKRVMDAYEDALRDLRKPKKSIIQAKQLEVEAEESEHEGNNEYEVLRGLLAQFPNLLSYELKQKWMLALGLKRNTENVKARFNKYYSAAQKEISEK